MQAETDFSVPGNELLNCYAPLKPVAGCHPLIAHQAEDVFTLWKAWEQQTGEERPVPFWAAVWPAAILLSRNILSGKIDVEDISAIDLGCAGAIAAIAAAKAGAAKVIANDIDTSALHIAAKNAAANNVDIDTDSTNYIEKDEMPSADLILVADMFYHKSDSEKLLALLHKANKKGSRIIISDAGRTFAPRSGISAIITEKIEVNQDLEGCAYREVSLYELNG